MDTIIAGRTRIAAGAALGLALACGIAGAAGAGSTVRARTPAPARAVSADSGATVLKGGASGTVFRSLTIEGEDRVHLDFDRPELRLDLDPASAPGLECGTARDVLVRTSPDIVGPLLATSATASPAYLGRPWLHAFASGAVARFTPDVRGVERWQLLVADARGRTVASFQGHGEPPKTIDWDGRSQDGRPVTPGLTYSYVFEAYDRAGNRRHFVGRGFTVSAYRLESDAGPVLLFSAGELRDTDDDAARGATPAIVLEAASWLNQSARPGPLDVRATARSADQAAALAARVTAQLRPLLLGDPARVRATTAVEPDAPEDGTVAIGPTR